MEYESIQKCLDGSKKRIHYLDLNKYFPNDINSFYEDVDKLLKYSTYNCFVISRIFYINGMEIDVR